jgi:hypothetical protein
VDAVASSIPQACQLAPVLFARPSLQPWRPGGFLLRRVIPTAPANSDPTDQILCVEVLVQFDSRGVDVCGCSLVPGAREIAPVESAVVIGSSEAAPVASAVVRSTRAPVPGSKKATPVASAVVHGSSEAAPAASAVLHGSRGAALAASAVVGSMRAPFPVSREVTQGASEVVRASWAVVRTTRGVVLGGPCARPLVVGNGSLDESGRSQASCARPLVACGRSLDESRGSLEDSCGPLDESGRSQASRVRPLVAGARAQSDGTGARVVALRAAVVGSRDPSRRARLSIMSRRELTRSEERMRNPSRAPGVPDQTTADHQAAR